MSKKDSKSIPPTLNPSSIPSALKSNPTGKFVKDSASVPTFEMAPPPPPPKPNKE